MAGIANDVLQRFIATEPTGIAGEAGEKKVWDAIRSAFASRKDFFAFWHYPIFARIERQLKEPDFLIADRELGLIIIEVKSILITQIESIQGYLWKYRNYYTDKGNPYEQARRQLQPLLDYCNQEAKLVRNALCEIHGQLPEKVNNSGGPPNAQLAAACSRLMLKTEIKECFDAILMDEAQDMVVEAEFKHEGKQPIFWLAYKSLRMCDAERSEQRRLIWAYDEAQSLDTLTIPTASEIFGAELSGLMSGLHVGGIKKSEIMQKCYRTPGPILTAAHSIGMGLLRSEGMLSGITTKEGWNAIGYEVIGNFNPPGQQVTIYRPPENSPNRMPEVWGSPVIEFQTYATRQDEFASLARAIRHNLEHDGLLPSRDILVVVVGPTREAAQLREDVARYLMQQGISIFTPSALEPNVIKPTFPNVNANNFWCAEAITVSQVHRAKGNEAEMVYVVGFDLVARDESNVNLRNGLFVALTRTRGWVRLSGVGDYPMCDEMRWVIAAGNSFTFTFDRPIKRNVEDD